MTRLGTAYIPIDGDWDRFNRQLKAEGNKLDRTFKQRGLGLGKVLGGGIATAGAAGFAAIVLESKRAVAAFEETRKITAQTRAVLASTGGVANVTATRVDRLAAALSRKTGVDDEAIASGQNLLLTFTNVRNEAGRGNKIFDQATRAITDMSAALGQDTKSSAIQVGKALNDPIKGVTALQRVGVSFTASEKAKIKTLVESGAALSAQKIILRELNREFQGSAEAQATATDKMKVAIGNIEEAIGKGLSPAVDAVAGDLTDMALKAEPAITRVSDRINRIFEREDLDLGEKLTLSAGDVKRALRPFVEEGRTAIGEMNFDERLPQLVEDAAPKIADAMAAAAPHAAAAFVRSFKEAGPWGQLLTVAFLAQKLGAFSTIGGMASDRFIARFRAKSIPAAGAAGVAAGGAYSTRFTATSNAAITGAAAGGKFNKAARSIGRVMGPVAAVYIASEIADELTKQFGHKGGTQGVIDKVAQDVRNLIDQHNSPGITAPRGGVPRDPDNRPRTASARTSAVPARSPISKHPATRRAVHTARTETTRRARRDHPLGGALELDTLNVGRLIVAHAEGLGAASPRRAGGDVISPLLARTTSGSASAAAQQLLERARHGHDEAVARARQRLVNDRQAFTESLGTLSKFDENGVQLLAPAQLAQLGAARPARAGSEPTPIHVTNQVTIKIDGPADPVRLESMIGRQIEQRTVKAIGRAIERKGG